MRLTATQNFLDRLVLVKWCGLFILEVLCNGVEGPNSGASLMITCDAPHSVEAVRYARSAGVTHGGWTQDYRGVGAKLR